MRKPERSARELEGPYWLVCTLHHKQLQLIWLLTHCCLLAGARHLCPTSDDLQMVSPLPDVLQGSLLSNRACLSTQMCAARPLHSPQEGWNRK